MYLIAACLPRLRALISRLHATVSASFSSLLGRHYGSNNPQPSATSERQVPRIDMKLTGQGVLTSLIPAEKVGPGGEGSYCNDDAK